MITITFDYFENCILLLIITITDYDYPRSGSSSDSEASVSLSISKVPIGEDLAHFESCKHELLRTEERVTCGGRQK